MTHAETTDAERLWGYVETWRATADDVLVLLRDLTPEDWARPTDLTGWDVRAVASHLAHLESELAGNPQADVEVPPRDHIRSSMGHYTERGPVARVGWPTAEIVDELETAVSVRYARLREEPPTEGAGAPPTTPGGIGWNWQTLLSNRVVDCWMHEQDIRRATNRPGGYDRPGAAHTVESFADGFGYVVGKRVQPRAGTTVALHVTGGPTAQVTVEEGVDGRARRVPEPVEPTVLLTMGAEAYIVLSGGRRGPEAVDVEVVGDRAVGDAVLAALPLTP